MIQQDTVELLGRIHPLDQLPASELEGLCREAALEYYRRGTRILVQDGRPTQHLFVITRGTVCMYLTGDDGSELVVDYRGAGEFFGLLSLISGEAPRSNVRAEEDTIGLLIPRRELLAALDAHPKVSDRLLKSYFLDFIDRTYEETRRRSNFLGNGHRILFATPVGELVHRDPVATRGSTSIQEAARLMVAQGISSLVVTDGAGSPIGIMTDRDLREKIVAEGRDLEDPVSAIMSAPIVQVDAGEPSFEALFKMMRHNIHHVLVTEEGRFRGMVTNHDFMVMQGSSPTLLIRKVLEAAELEHLDQTRPRLQAMVAVLSREGARAHNISRVITEVARKLVQRTLALAEAELGPPATPVTVFVLGEAGRSELGLNRGPELALACADHEETDPSVRTYAAQLRARLEGGPVAARFGEGEEARTVSEWRQLLHRWVEGQADLPAGGAGMFEMAAVSGDPHPLEEARLDLVRSAAEDEGLRARLVAESVANPPPLGFLGKLVVATSGEHRDELDLYRKGIAPLAEVVRILALEKGITVRSTLGRLRELRARNGYARADEIENALEHLHTLRIHQQLADIEAGKPPDEFVNPASLSNGERKTLKEAFQLIASLHDTLARRYGVQGGGA